MIILILVDINMGEYKNTTFLSIIVDRAQEKEDENLT
jgi:hypothetical protein